MGSKECAVFGVSQEAEFITHLTQTGSFMGRFKAVDKLNRGKWVVLGEIQPTFRDLIFDAFKQPIKLPVCVR